MSDLLLRDGAMTAAVLGFFASAWFGWAQERPPARWRLPLAAGAVGGMLLALAAGTVAGLHWTSGSVLDDPEGYRTYLVVVGVESGVAAVGAVVLLLLGRSDWTAPWVCLVVGVHFVPLAPVLDNPALYALAVLLTAWAVAAPLLAARRRLPTSLVTGAGAGAALLCFALWAAVGLLV